VVRGSPFVAWFKDSNLLYTPGPARELEDALDALAAAGIINTPAYWLQNYTALPYLDQLILNMAAYVRQQRG
jgi:hypothetical protein